MKLILFFFKFQFLNFIFLAFLIGVSDECEIIVD